MIRLLQRTIPTKDARSVCFDVVIEEALWGHSFVIALRHLIIMWQVQPPRLLSKKVVKVVVSQMFPQTRPEVSQRAIRFLVKAYEYKRNHDN